MSGRVKQKCGFFFMDLVMKTDLADRWEGYRLLSRANFAVNEMRKRNGLFILVIKKCTYPGENGLLLK